MESKPYHTSLTIGCNKYTDPNHNLHLPKTIKLVVNDFMNWYHIFLWFLVVLSYPTHTLIIKPYLSKRWLRSCNACPNHLNRYRSLVSVTLFLTSKLFVHWCQQFRVMFQRYLLSNTDNLQSCLLLKATSHICIVKQRIATQPTRPLINRQTSLLHYRWCKLAKAK